MSLGNMQPAFRLLAQPQGQGGADSRGDQSEEGHVSAEVDRRGASRHAAAGSGARTHPAVPESRWLNRRRE